VKSCASKATTQQRRVAFLGQKLLEAKCGYIVASSMWEIHSSPERKHLLSQ